MKKAHVSGVKVITFVGGVYTSIQSIGVSTRYTWSKSNLDVLVAGLETISPNISSGFPVPLHSQFSPQLVLPLHHLSRQRVSNSEKHKKCPFPPERVNQDDEHEPIRQLRVCEEVERASRGTGFDVFRHVDPFLHPVFAKPG